MEEKKEKKGKKEQEMRSLNEELPTLYVEMLEQRLETDPLGVGGLLDPNADYQQEARVCIIKINICAKGGELID